MEHKIRVFLADPSAQTVMLLRRSLENAADLEVVGTATDGLTALDALKRVGADVLLTDILLPGLDGFALADAAHGVGLTLPAVFLSAYGGEGVIARARRCGGSILPKPCGLHHILRRLRAAVCMPEAERADAPAIAAALRAFGIPEQLTGSDYLAAALKRTTADPALLGGITKTLYPELAQRFSASPAGVERAMRTAIEKAWRSRNEPKRRAFFGTAFAYFVRTPTNARFLTVMTRVIQAKSAEWQANPASDPRRFAWLWM